jgi:hypothetical protein
VYSQLSEELTRMRSQEIRSNLNSWRGGLPADRVGVRPRGLRPARRLHAAVMAALHGDR